LHARHPAAASIMGHGKSFNNVSTFGVHGVHVLFDASPLHLATVSHPIVLLIFFFLVNQPRRLVSRRTAPG